MPHILSAVVPNSPLILPGLSGEVRRKTAKTRQACEKIASDIYARQTNLLLWLTLSQEKISNDGITIIQGKSLSYTFTELADVTTRGQAQIAVGFSHHIQEMLETKFPCKLVSSAELPDEFAISYAALSEIAKQIPSVFISIPKQISIDNLVRLGTLLENILAETNERVTVVACGILSFHVPELAVEARVHDQAFQHALTVADVSELTNLESSTRERVHNTLWIPAVLITHLSVWHPFGFSIINYDAALGVGLLTAEQQFT